MAERCLNHPRFEAVSFRVGKEDADYVEAPFSPAGSLELVNAIFDYLEVFHAR